MHFCPLLAKGDLYWVQVAFAAIMFIIYIVNLVANRQRKGQPPKPASSAARRLPVPEGNARRAPAPSRPAAPQKTDPLLAEIQKFLKQANPEKRSTGRPQSAAAKPVRVEPIVLRGTPAVGDAVGRPLDSRHLDTTEFGTRASQMTDDLKRGDAQREQHFQQTFTHKLGRLTDTSVAGDKAIAPDAPAVSTVPVAPIPLSDWLPLPTTKPEDLRRAFMLNEILQRPEHRW